MTKKQLIQALEQFPDDMQVTVLDGFNGGGSPREINDGPHIRKITENDAEDCADCEDLVGQTVIVLGYGSY